MNDKTATVATRGVSRAFEGMVGAVLGGAVGGVAGALAYEPRKPQEWIDERGNIYDRPLTGEEQKTRLAVATAGALAGALGGAGITAGGSALLRARVTAVERDGAQRVANEFLTPLQHLIDDWTAGRAAHLSTKPGAAGSAIAKRMDKRIETARVMMRKQKEVVDVMVDVAADRRAGLPFVGGLLNQTKGVSGYNWNSMKHDGMVAEHANQFAKKHGFPEMNLDNAYRVFTDAVSSKMTKVSSAAFHAELEKIGAAFDLMAGQTSRLAQRAPALRRTVGAMSFRAPKAMELGVEGAAKGAQGSSIAKLRNNAASAPPMPPAKVSTPPTPDPTPGI